MPEQSENGTQEDRAKRPLSTWTAVFGAVMAALTAVIAWQQVRLATEQDKVTTALTRANTSITKSQNQTSNGSTLAMLVADMTKQQNEETAATAAGTRQIIENVRLVDAQQAAALDLGLTKAAQAQVGLTKPPGIDAFQIGATFTDLGLYREARGWLLNATADPSDPQTVGRAWLSLAQIDYATGPAHYAAARGDILKARTALLQGATTTAQHNNSLLLVDLSDVRFGALANGETCATAEGEIKEAKTLIGQYMATYDTVNADLLLAEEKIQGCPGAVVQQVMELLTILRSHRDQALAQQARTKRFLSGLATAVTQAAATPGQ